MKKDISNKLDIYKLKKSEELLKYYQDWTDNNKYNKNMVDWNYAAYANTLEKDIKFIKKRTLKWFKSSKKARRGFCNKCGASMFSSF